MASKVVVVGSFNMDLTTTVDRMPRPGETVLGDVFTTGPGGKGSNQAIAAARLGAHVTFVGRIGTDAFGQAALAIWAQDGVDTRHIIRDPDHATGVAPIFVDKDGENMIVVALGANLALSPADVDAAADAIRTADILLTGLEIPIETAAHALKIAKAAGVRTILNPAPAQPLTHDMLLSADVLTPNESELEVLSGLAIDDVEQAAQLVKAHDNQHIVVTLGGQGAAYYGPGGHGVVPVFPVSVVDTTGAGDAFNGGLAVALSDGLDMPEAVRFAGATAALCVTKRGTAASMPTRAEVDTLLKGSTG
ncbi:MAG: ribokinase [Chloroflexi bacterium]|nr:ribokinase [Chloroflexota bacterium]